MIIQSNGSKWSGEAPDSVDTLLSLLQHEPLDPLFKDYSNFVIEENEEECRMFGNFKNISHVFDIRASREELRPIIASIRANQQREGYKACSP